MSQPENTKAMNQGVCGNIRPEKTEHTMMRLRTQIRYMEQDMEAGREISARRFEDHVRLQTEFDDLRTMFSPVCRILRDALSYDERTDMGTPTQMAQQAAEHMAILRRKLSDVRGLVTSLLQDHNYAGGTYVGQCDLRHELKMILSATH